MLFEAGGKLYHGLACHFGGACSESWWKRVAALITAIIHPPRWLQHADYVYVDGWLGRLMNERCILHGCLIALVLAALGLPLCWHK